MNRCLTIFVVIVMLMTGCNITGPQKDTAFDEINQENAFELFQKSSGSSLKHIRNNPGLGEDYGVTMIDIIPDGQNTDPYSDFVPANQFGQTELKFNGETIFQNSWNFPYMVSSRMKTIIRFGHKGQFGVISLDNESLHGEFSGTELRVWYFNQTKNLHEIDLSKISAPEYSIGHIGPIVFYEDCLFLDIFNGWARRHGPHELVVYHLPSGEFKKFTFPE